MDLSIAASVLFYLTCGYRYLDMDFSALRLILSEERSMRCYAVMQLGRAVKSRNKKRDAIWHPFLSNLSQPYCADLIF